MPCRNAGAFLADAVRSVLEQRSVAVERIEIVVVDDASDDPETLSMLERLSHGEARGLLRVLRHRTAQGAGRSRNAALSATRGRFTAFLDADDIWHPDHLATHLAMHRRQRLALSVTDCLSADVNLKPVVHGALAAHALKRRWLAPAYDSGGPWYWQDARRLFVEACPAWTGCVVARRDAIERTGGFDPRLRFYQDVHFWIRLATLGAFAFDPAVTASYRMHETSSTHGSQDPEMDWWLGEALSSLTAWPGLEGEVPALRRRAAAAYLSHAWRLRHEGTPLGAWRSVVRAARLGAVRLSMREAMVLVATAVWPRLAESARAR